MGAIQARGPRQRRVEGMSYQKATDRKMSRERRDTGKAEAARTADFKHLKSCRIGGRVDIMLCSRGRIEPPG